MRWDIETKETAKHILAIFIATRLLLVVIALLVEALLPLKTAQAPWDDRPVIESLTRFDAVYYLGMADEGYHQQPVSENHHDWVFFPGYPMVVRATSIATFGDLALAGVLVANVAFLGALCAFYILSRRYLDHPTSLRAITYLSIAPGAVAFAMAYSDSLFLLLAILAFLAAERGRWPLLAVAVAAATLTRLPGVALILPLAILILQRPETPRRVLVWLASGPVALLGLMAYQGAALGQPLGFLAAQASWNFPSRGANLPIGATPPFDPVPILLTLVLVGYLFLFVYARVDRIRLPYLIFMAVAVIGSLASLRLLSLPRYLAVIWPFDWILASRRASWFRATWPVISVGLFTLFAVLHFSGALAP